MERLDIVQTVAANIEAIMGKRGFNAASLARAAALNRTAVYDIMKGKSRNPRLDTVVRLAAALNVPVARLFEARASLDDREEYLSVFERLPEQERKRLLQAAQALFPTEGDQALEKTR